MFEPASFRTDTGISEMELQASELHSVESDWIFATILGNVPKTLRDTPFSSSSGIVSAFTGDPDTFALARSLMFQAALSVCDTGGNAIYFTPTRWTTLPMKMLWLPYPDIASLRRLKMVYRTNPRETVRVLLEDIKKTSGSKVLLVCIEDLSAMCRSVGRRTDWSVVKSMASVLSSLEEVILSACSMSVSLHILCFVNTSMDPQCKDVFRRFGVQASNLTIVGDTSRAQLFGPIGNDSPVREISLTLTTDGLKCSSVSSGHERESPEEIRIDG